MTVYIEVLLRTCNEIALQGVASAATVFFSAGMPLFSLPPRSQGAEETLFLFRTLNP